MFLVSWQQDVRKGHGWQQSCGERAREDAAGCASSCLSEPGACLGRGVSAQAVHCVSALSLASLWILGTTASMHQEPAGQRCCYWVRAPYPGAPELASSQRGLVSPVHSWKHLEDFNKLLFGIEVGWGKFTLDLLGCSHEPGARVPA